VKDLRSELPRIAHFLGLQMPLQKELVERVLRTSTKKEMLSDVSKYSDAYLKQRMNLSGHYPVKWNIPVITPKVTGLWDDVNVTTAEFCSLVERDFCRHIGDVFQDCAGYKDLQDAIRKGYKKIDKLNYIHGKGNQLYGPAGRGVGGRC